MAGYPESASLPCPSCGALNTADSAACAACGTAIAAAPRIEPGAVLSRRYEIQQVLGAGGMGMVLKAHDRELDETVAVKVLRADLARSEDMARRFRTEIKLARRVRHHNVCGIHEYGSDGGVAYIAMEFIRGTDLKHLIRQRGALRTEEAFDVCIQIAEGLQAIHEAGIIHRDLKTSNVMLDSKGRVVLMDFGIAKDTQQSTALGATAVGQVIGTPEYMSPEQARGRQIDTRSDLYALGIIVFEVFSGHVPFQGTTPIATLFKNLEEPPPLQGAMAVGIPRSVIPVLAKALAKDRAERFQSAREVVEAMRLARAETLGPGHTPVPRTATEDSESTRTLLTPGSATEQPATLASVLTAVPSTTSVPTAVPTARTFTAPPLPPPKSTVAAAAVSPVPETLVTPAPPTARASPPAVQTPSTSPPPLPLRSPPPGSVRREGLSPAVVIGGGAVLVVGLLMAGWLILASEEHGATGSRDAGGTTPATPAPASPSSGPLTTAAPAPPHSVPPRPVPTPTPAIHEPVTPLPRTQEPTRTPVPQPPATPAPTPAVRVPDSPPITRPVSPPPAAKAPALLQVRVRPWAQVSVDEEIVGTTPFAPLPLSPGPHDLEFVHPDFRPVRRKVTLRAGETLKVELDMALDAVPK